MYIEVRWYGTIGAVEAGKTWDCMYLIVYIMNIYYDGEKNIVCSIPFIRLQVRQASNLCIFCC